MTHSKFEYGNHELRKELGLTINQMAVLSEITYRSWIDETFMWCTLRTETIGGILSFTNNEVHEAVSGLMIKKYVEFPDDIGEDDSRIRCSRQIKDVKQAVDSKLPDVHNNVLAVVSHWLAKSPEFDSNCVAILGYCLGGSNREIGRDEIMKRLKIGKTTYYKCLDVLERNGYCVRSYKSNYDKGKFGFNKSGHFFFGYPVHTMEWEVIYGFGKNKEGQQ